MAKELAEMKAKLASLETSSAAKDAKLAVFEQREAREQAIEKALKTVPAGHAVDRAALGEVVKHLPVGDALEATVATVVKSMIKPVGTTTTHVAGAQPGDKPAGATTGSGRQPSLRELHASNPEGFKAASEKMRAETPFMAKR